MGFVQPPPQQPEADPGEALAVIAKGALELNLAPLWDNLPATWKGRANHLVEELQTSANPALWQLGFKLIEAVASLSATDPSKASGIDQSEVLADLWGLKKGQPEEVTANVIFWRLRLAASLQTITTSGLNDPKNLAYLDLRELARDFLPSVEKQLAKVGPNRLLAKPWTGILEAAVAAGQKAEEQQVSFSLDLPKSALKGPITKLELIQVENCWVPKRLAGRVPLELKKLSIELEDWTQKPGSPRSEYARGLLEASLRGVAKLEAVKDDPSGFDLALNEMLGELSRLVIGQKVRSFFK